MIRIRASLIALKYFKNSEKERLENDLIDIMGVNLETGKMKPEGPIGVKPRSFIVDIVTDFVQKMVIIFRIAR